MTVSAFAKDKLGKSPSLNCFSSYLFHGRRRLFPFQLFVLGILLSLSVKGRGRLSRCCKVPVGLELGCRECTPGSHSAGSGAALDPSAPSHLGSAASVSSFLPFQGFWSFSISFSVFLSLALLLQVLFWEVCIPVSPFQSWYVKLGNGRCDSWAHISFFFKLFQCFHFLLSCPFP